MENKLIEMQLKKLSGKEVVGIDRFRESEKQKIYLCLHPSNHIGEYHAHDFYEINFVYKGRCINLIEDENHILNEGDAVIIHHNTFHLLFAYGECRVFNFLIEREWFERLADNILKNDGMFYKFLCYADKQDFFKYAFCKNLKINERIYQAIEKIIRLNQETKSGKYILQEAGTLEFISALVEEDIEIFLSNGRGGVDNNIVKILSYMSENYKTVTLKSISERFFYSKTHICRLFTKNANKTFNQTLMEMRLSRAEIMLLKTDLKIKEIAESVGYESVEYFQRLFKKKTGLTPCGYRKAKQKRQ